MSAGANSIVGFNRKRLLELAGEEEGAAVEQESLSDFFHAVPPEDKGKRDKLAKAIEEQLSGVKVYKVGDLMSRRPS